MLDANFANLISFIPQYVVSTLAAVYTFTVLRKRRFYSRPEFYLLDHPKSIVGQIELLGMSFYSAMAEIGSMISAIFIIPSPGQLKPGIPNSGFRSGLGKGDRVATDAMVTRRSRSSFKGPSTRVKFPEIYLRKGIYDLYSALFSIAVWAGILLLLTPYQQIFIFIPHFSSLTVNLAVIIVLSITIFEGTLASLFLFIGTSRKRVALVMLSVMGIFSLSLLTPSFNWFRIYTLTGELLIYAILGILLLSTTFLISLFKEKRILFNLAFYSTVVAYIFLISTTGYNILVSIIPGL